MKQSNWGQEYQIVQAQKEMMVTVKELEAIVPFILVFDRKLSLFSYRVKKIQIAIVNDHAENLGKKIWVSFPSKRNCMLYIHFTF